MKIGLTYDLRDAYLAAGYGEQETAEFDRAETIDALAAALGTLGHQVERIGHVRALVQALARGERWDLVFNIAEGLSGPAREAQVPAVLEAFGIACTFADPLVMALSLHKALTKRVLRDLGLPTAEFAVVTCPSDIEHVGLPFPLFVKPLAEGTAKGIDSQSRVANRAALRRACREVLGSFGQPALIERFLPGREFTVGITGTGADAVAVGTMQVVLGPEAEAHAYTYVNKEECERRCRFPLADPASAAAAESLALAAWRGLGCRDAGRVDLRADADDRLHVMELNPLPGLHPTHSDLPMICTAVGLDYVDLIGRIVASAATRMTGADARLRHPAMTGGMALPCGPGGPP